MTGTRAPGRAVVATGAALVLLAVTGCATASLPGAAGLVAGAGRRLAALQSCAVVHQPRGTSTELGPAAVPGGPVLLRHDGVPWRAIRPLEGSDARPWSPAAPLPARDPSAAGVLVVYTPHPDDETLSMGVLVAAAVRRHEQVVVVALTDGTTTRADAVDGEVLTHAEVGASRDSELLRAMAAYGVPASDVVFAHLDAPDSDCGALVTVSEARAVMRTVATQYPDATNVTMSWTAERNQDHLDAGIALRELVEQHVVRRALWAISRMWWTVPSPSAAWVTATDPRDIAAVRRAAAAYGIWDPRLGEYAIGLRSVTVQFRALALDPRDRVHGADGPVLRAYAVPAPLTAPGRGWPQLVHRA
jgi:LmbE family N-acetylglucosaminyl deacetylase